MFTSTRRRALFALLVVLALLGGCERAEEPRTQVSDADAVAVVNDVVITREEFEEFLALQRMSRPAEDLQREQVLDEMISLELLRQAAVERGLDRDPEILRQVERSKTNLMVGALLEDWLGPEYTEEQLRAEYDRQVRDIDREEFKARHILLDTEEDAEAVIRELEEGADFEAMAREHSTGPSGPMGGDLGWFTANQMVSEFSDAVRALEPGTFTREPVQSDFGWHVILLEDTRTAEPPPFEAVRSRLEEILDNRIIQENIEDLRQRADIEIR
ncbi:peptidylprolyl isomerase [Thioalkalivibrio denitrificans]|uniref:peptidylprolyl isomerase n=1 Tax=Thioalkalivibrio denitrificans TaxID=108003 RepID=A0A1V3NLF6_9GAMM|nr:peptidylprolyl isomerase [Thioalkalivibrio denitrificans]OOG25949.1 peptidylprolyl isomerase [Thioalkalivibrio denitrificans]